MAESHLQPAPGLSLSEHPRSRNSGSAAERLHALDAVRAIALLLGIVLHGTMSFTPGLAAAGWPIEDVNAHEATGFISYVIHVFRMSAFFLIAGFFAHLVFHRRGWREFAKDRSRRILLPLLLFYIPLMAVMAGIVIWSVISTGWQPPEGTAPPAVLSLAHLWFLYELVWLYILVLLLRPLIVRLEGGGGLRLLADRCFAWLLSSPIGVPLLAVPVIALLYATPDWIAAEGIRTQMEVGLPIWQPLFIYFYLFSLGWMLDRQRQLLAVIREKLWLNSGIALGTVLLNLHLIGWEIKLLEPLAAGMKLPFAIIYGIAVVASTLAFIGAGLVLFSKESPVMRYLADASYWIYLAHMPLIMFWQVLLMDVPLHWLIKYPLIC